MRDSRCSLVAWPLTSWVPQCWQTNAVGHPQSPATRHSQKNRTGHIFFRAVRAAPRLSTGVSWADTICTIRTIAIQENVPVVSTPLPFSTQIGLLHKIEAYAWHSEFFATSQQSSSKAHRPIYYVVTVVEWGAIWSTEGSSCGQ